MSNTNSQKSNSEKKPKKLSGIVVSNKMTDTTVVKVGRYFKHSKYEKYIKLDKKYKAHDKGNIANIGDQVEITECRPISKDKHFMLTKIISKAPTVDFDKE